MHTLYMRQVRFKEAEKIKSVSQCINLGMLKFKDQFFFSFYNTVFPFNRVDHPLILKIISFS